MRTSGYSLWLVPGRDSKVFARLRDIIDLASTAFQTPAFDPHVTLLGGPTGDERIIREKTRTLATLLDPYEVRLGDVATHRTYLQVLFSKVEQTPQVMTANARAGEVFGLSTGSYFPHLSLAYGELTEEQIAKAVQSHRTLSGISFTARAIELWHCEGTVTKWSCVEAFPFSIK